jgi:Fe-S-cluster containining protein
MNPCKNCALCCMDTEMPLSDKDIALILTYHKSDIKEEDFIEYKSEGLRQLKNKDGSCFFLDIQQKLCKIYDFRPTGCRFYPIVFDIENRKCIYDKDCPRTKLFHLPNKSYKTLCNQIKKFIINELNIPI